MGWYFPFLDVSWRPNFMFRHFYYPYWLCCFQRACIKEPYNNIGVLCLDTLRIACSQSETRDLVWTGCSEECFIGLVIKALSFSRWLSTRFPSRQSKSEYLDLITSSPPHAVLIWVQRCDWWSPKNQCLIRKGWIMDGHTGIKLTYAMVGD